MRRRWRWALVGVLLAVLGIATLPGVIHRQILGLGATDIHNVASLPDRISVCGRDWSRDALGRQFGRAELVSRTGGEPTLVDPMPFGPCPPGPCKPTGADPCETVVYVRVGEDSYLGYELSGGP